MENIHYDLVFKIRLDAIKPENPEQIKLEHYEYVVAIKKVDGDNIYFYNLMDNLYNYMKIMEFFSNVAKMFPAGIFNVSTEILWCHEEKKVKAAWNTKQLDKRGIIVNRVYDSIDELGEKKVERIVFHFRKFIKEYLKRNCK